VRPCHRLVEAALVFGALAAVLLPAWAVSAAPVGSIAAGPRFQAASAPAGETITFLIDVRNFNEHEALPVSFLLSDLDPQGWLAAPQTTPYSLAGLATLPTPLTLGPGEIKHVSVTARSDGRTHYGSVVVVAGPPAAPFARIALKVVLTSPDAAAVPDVHLTPTSTGTIKMDLRNNGEGFLSGRGVLFLLSSDGRFLGRLDIPLLAVLPHGASSLTLQWPEKLPAGTVARAALTLEGRDEPFVVSATVP
jgi:hypothetical protein